MRVRVRGSACSRERARELGRRGEVGVRVLRRPVVAPPGRGEERGRARHVERARERRAAYPPRGGGAEGRRAVLAPLVGVIIRGTRRAEVRISRREIGQRSGRAQP